MQKFICLILLFVSISSTTFAQTNLETVSTQTGPLLTLTTDYGTVKIRLYDQTPYHRDNFLKLVREGFYNDLLFHRVIKDFMI